LFLSLAASIQWKRKLALIRRREDAMAGQALTLSPRGEGGLYGHLIVVTPFGRELFHIAEVITPIASLLSPD
jgi:hypothetical protein